MNGEAANADAIAEVMFVSSTLEDLVTSYEGWMALRLCGQVDPELWFPAKGGSTLPAKRICAECPVRAQCLEYALERNEQFGVWGGLSTKERMKILRSRRDGVATPDAA